MIVLALVPGVVTLVAGAAMVVGGIVLVRRPSRVPRVPIDAVIVDFSNFTKVKRVTFDYPAPDGTWLRATKVAGLPVVSTRGFLVRPGDTIRVHVDPANPVDVSLGEVGSAGGFAGIFLAIAGGGAVIVGLGIVAEIGLGG